jgi:hypothetical protein
VKKVHQRIAEQDAEDKAAGIEGKGRDLLRAGQLVDDKLGENNGSKGHEPLEYAVQQHTEQGRFAVLPVELEQELYADK